MYNAGKTNINADALSRNPVTKRSLQEERSNKLKIRSIDKCINISGTPEKLGLAGKQRGDNENLFNVFPANYESDDSDSDVIFEPHRAEEQENINKETNNNNNNRDVDINDERQEDDNNTNISSDKEFDEGTSSSGSELFENINPPFVLSKPDFQQIRDNFNMRKDNLVIFITKTGEPCDEGAHILVRENPGLNLRNNTLGRAKVINQPKRRIIALTIKERFNQTTDVKIFKETLHSLLDVVTELGIEIISICKVAEIDWDSVKGYLQRVFLGTELAIMICINQIETPSIDYF